MELTKSLYEALAKMQSFDDLQAFMRVATIKGSAPKTRFNIFDYVSTDKERPALCGVYQCELTNSQGEPYGGVAVATDAYIMLTSSKDYRDDLKYEILRKDGTLVKIKTGESIERRMGGKREDILTTPSYPNYRAAIDGAERQSTHAAGIPEISEYYIEELAKFEVEYKQVQSELPAKKRTKLYPKIAMMFGEHTLWFNYKQLQLFITAARHIGATQIKYRPCEFKATYTSKEPQWHEYPMYAQGENPSDFVLLMPLKEENSDGKHVTETETFARYNNPDMDL